MGVARKGSTPEERAGLLPRLACVALVGHRYLADRREHLGRADRRHVGLRLRDGHGDRVVRMDGGAHADRRRQMDPAGVPQERHLHDAGIPREALQPGRAQRHGRLLARAVHIREPHLDPVARLARRERDCGRRPADRDHRARGLRARVRPLRRPEGCGVDRHRAGLAARARRHHHHVDFVGQGRRRCGCHRRLPDIDDQVSRQVRHDPVARQPALQGSAGPRRIVRRHVDDERRAIGASINTSSSAVSRPRASTRRRRASCSRRFSS